MMLTMEQRVSQLEKMNRQWVAATVASLAIAAAVVLMGAQAATPPVAMPGPDQREVEVKTIRAQSFHLIDSEGNVAGEWGLQKNSNSGKREVIF